jgi:hypothetical protein
LLQCNLALGAYPELEKDASRHDKREASAKEPKEQRRGRPIGKVVRKEPLDRPKCEKRESDEQHNASGASFDRSSPQDLNASPKRFD